MHPDYFGRLSAPVQHLVREVEQGTNIDIQVVSDARLNDGGPLRQGNLEVLIEARRIEIRAPTNGYFPDGAVRHEVLHARRFHLDGVPKLALADEEDWDDAFAKGLTRLDNAIEHVVIVPIELLDHPERREHWEAVMQAACLELPDVPPEERSLAVCMHWTFLRHVLPGSPQLEVVQAYAIQHGLFEGADRFANQFLEAMASKEAIARLLLQSFPEIPWHRAALEYIHNSASTRQTKVL